MFAIRLLCSTLLASSLMFIASGTAQAGEGKVSIGKGIKCFYTGAVSPSGEITRVRVCRKGV